MSRTLTLATLLCIATTGGAHASEPEARLRLMTPLRQAEQLADHSEWGEHRPACEVMDHLWRTPEVKAQEVEAHAQTLLLAAYVFMNCERADDALIAAREAEALLPRSYTVGFLAQVALGAKRYDEAADRLVRVAREWPASVTREHLDIAWGLYRGWRDNPGAQRRLLQSLLDARFEPSDAIAEPLWYELARLHLDAGDVTRARAAAGRTSGVMEAVKMRIDRRFDPVLAAEPSLGDVRAQGERRLASARTKAASHPGDVALLRDVADAQLLLGDHDATLRTVAAMTDTLGTPAERSAARPDYRPYLLMLRAVLHRRNGAFGPLLEDAEMASFLTVPGTADLGKLSRAATHCDLGRPDDAEAALDPAMDAMEYVSLYQALQRVCIATARDDSAAAAQHLATLREKATPDDMAFVLDAQLYMGDVAGAASTFIALLERPSTRADMLVVAQRDRDPPPAPGEKRYLAALEAMLARPDVRAAVEKVGRIETFDIFLGFD